MLQGGDEKNMCLVYGGFDFDYEFFLVVDGLLFCNLSCLTFFRGLQERERGCDSL